MALTSLAGRAATAAAAGAAAAGDEEEGWVIAWVADGRGCVEERLNHDPQRNSKHRATVTSDNNSQP